MDELSEIFQRLKNKREKLRIARNEPFYYIEKSGEELKIKAIL